ncbi:MAG: outer membrane beta-barrel protein [Bacteroidota bacterium]
MQIKTYLSALLWIIGIISVNAQSYQIEGKILDSLNTPMTGATVMLLQQQDSLLASFSIVGDKGQFALRNVPKGDYLLNVTFLGYESYMKAIRVEQDLALDPIRIAKENTLLDEIVVKDEIIPIRINKDTVEYNALAFGTQPNDKVEDLLRKLPGLEVDREGNIKAQGEDIGKVLVDGKAFFGDDPKMATKNLPADAVDKVQVFDRASDFAEFSGIDDGQEEKTINLQLKADKKNGYFGEATAAYGTEDRFETGLNLNRFGGQTQLSMLANSNNINKQAFSFQDYLNFMGGFQALVQGGRLSLDTEEIGIPMGEPTEGITTGTSGGLNFNHDFSDRTEWRSSYFYGRTRNDRISETFRQNFLDDGIFESNSASNRFSGSDNHRINLNLRHKIDSTARINVRSNLGYGDFFSDQQSDNRNFDPEGALQNQSINDYRLNGYRLSYSGNANYQKKLGKPGRTFSIAGNLTLEDQQFDAILESVNQFFSNGEFNSTDSLNQLQQDDNLEIGFGGRVSYTEPIGKKQFLEFNLEHQRSINEVDRTVFDLEMGNEQTLNSTLSNAFERLYTFTRGGLTYRLNRESFNFSTSLRIQDAHLSGQLITLGSEINQSFFNVLPGLRFNYDFQGSSNLEFTYSTDVREPGLEELSPVIDNSDPLNLYVGNPNLQVEYNHRFGLRFFSFSAFTFTSFFANLNTTYTRNKITDAKTIDAQFVQTTMPVNVDYELAINGAANLSTPLRFMGAKINLSTNQTYSQSLLFVNAAETGVERWISRGSVSIENRKKRLFDLLVGMDLSYNQTRYTDIEGLNQQFLRQDYYTDVDINFLKRLQFGSSFTYTIYGGDAFADAEQVALWESSIGIFILPNKRGQLNFRVFDILNQNQGIQRSSAFNFVQDQRSNNLGRYFMLGFTYNLSGFGKADPNEMRIELGGDGGRRRR